MQADRTATVLFAEPSNDAKRSQASAKAVAAAVISVAESTGGRVVQTSGGKLMVLFASPDAAASAASKMQASIKPGLQIGFHSGPVAAGGAPLADDTVRLALRLLARAQDGQTVTSQKTAEQLNPAFRRFSKPLGAPAGGADGDAVCEVASWHQKGVRPAGWSAMAVLRLTCGDQLVVCSREREAVVLGRGEDCDLVLAAKSASRRHCTIACRGGSFVLRDHSSNGCYVGVAGSAEIVVQEESFSLPEEGVISLGEPSSRAAELVEFCYALVT